jgi:sec-independent protein translocase protein TatA
MGGLSFWHILILAAIVLIFFGPSRLPNLGRSMGEAIRGFKKGLNEDPPEIDVTGSVKPEQLAGKTDAAAKAAEAEREKNRQS